MNYEEHNLLRKGMAYRPEIPHYSIVALIPARSGSMRVPNKNIRVLAGDPLMAHTINAALESGIFTGVYVSSDSPEYGEIARHYGASFLLRPTELARNDSPDVGWVKHALGQLPPADAFAILRPTSPFRPAGIIQQAWDRFQENQPADSLRAVEPVRQHPGKMWVIRGSRMTPLLPFSGDVAPWHSMPTQSLPRVCIQNASIEIAWTKTVTEQGSISGTNVYPFMVMQPEGFDINDEHDWTQAEAMAFRLPKLERKELVCP